MIVSKTIQVIVPVSVGEVESDAPQAAHLIFGESDLTNLIELCESVGGLKQKTYPDLADMRFHGTYVDRWLECDLYAIDAEEDDCKKSGQFFIVSGDFAKQQLETELSIECMSYSVSEDSIWFEGYIKHTGILLSSNAFQLSELKELLELVK
jgi:hypothetical protein